MLLGIERSLTKMIILELNQGKGLFNLASSRVQLVGRSAKISS